MKLPTIELPQTKEVIQLEKEKENMLRMIVKKNIQIQKMEVEMERLIKERELQLNTGVATSTT